MTHVFDTGAFIALERGSGRMLAFVKEAMGDGVTVWTSAGVIAQCWRGGPRQHSVARLLQSEFIHVEAIDDSTARSVGVLLGRSGTADVIDAHVALIAERTHGTIFTSDPDDLRRLAPRAEIIVV